MRALEQLVTAPLTVGSTASPVTLRSDDPATVSVEQDGRLVGHRKGSALITGAGSPRALVVEVRPVAALRLDRGRLELRRGETAALSAIGDGEPLGAGDVSWGTSDPAVAQVSGGRVVGVRGGTGTITARYGEATARCAVTVEREALAAIRPAKVRLRTGSVERFSALSKGGGELGATWRSSDEAKLRPLRGGYFAAVAAGRVEACASVAEQTRCTAVEVVR